MEDMWRGARWLGKGPKRREISFRESEWMVDLELFLDEYPQWGLGTPHQSVVLHEMFLHATG